MCLRDVSGSLAGGIRPIISLKAQSWSVPDLVLVFYTPKTHFDWQLDSHMLRFTA